MLFFNLLSAMVVSALVAVLYFYIQQNPAITPKRFLLTQMVIAFVLIFAWHLVIKYVLKNKLSEYIYLFSFNEELAELEKEVNNNSFLGFKLLGHLNEQSLKNTELRKDAGMVLPDNLSAKPEVMSKFYELRTKGVNFYNHRDFYEQLLRRVYISQLSEIWFLENISYREKRFYNLAKRIVDIVAGIFGSIAFVISLPFCALLIKLNSTGPVLFVQERVGKGGKLFKVYKYRTMQGPVTNTWTSVNDPRITGFGKFLRKSRIDEWPQFYNVLVGNMSLVGPRPEQPHIVEDMKKQIPFYDERHLVKPGISGWAQLNVYAGNVEETKLKLQYDLYYIKHRSIIFDLEIILKTIYYIFTWQGR